MKRSRSSMGIVQEEDMEELFQMEGVQVLGMVEPCHWECNRYVKARQRKTRHGFLALVTSQRTSILEQVVNGMAL